MANQEKDLRKETGKPPGVSKANFAGEENQKNAGVRDDSSGEHTVKPLPGNSGGVAPGQVTKSN
ncbi:MAG TPA: hypothetical protein VHV26_16105 [Rhizomicrobium sp.]|nr:hypothetical protein [Rhizomicrobium sp.]